MLLPNPFIDHQLLKRIVIDQYDVGAGELEFVPLGEDSWCYRLGRVWVSVRRDYQGHFPEAYAAARCLQNSELPFVLGPNKGRDGKIVRVIDGFPVVVFPFVNAAPLTDGASLTPIESFQVSDLISRIHAATTDVVLGEESYRLTAEFALNDCLKRATCHPSVDCLKSRPFGLQLYRIVLRHRGYIKCLQAEIAKVSEACHQRSGPYVLTHGEPSNANILRLQDKEALTGSLVVADWGALLWGPPERDWFHAHRTLGLHVNGRSEFFRFYELRWILSEIAEYLEHFLNEHVGNTNDQAMWNRFLRYLPGESTDGYNAKWNCR